MDTTKRSVLIGVAFALGGVVIAGVSIGLVRALQRHHSAEAEQAGSDRSTGWDQSGSEQPGDEQLDDGLAVDGSSDPAAGLPADMRPDDPSYGPII